VDKLKKLIHSSLDNAKAQDIVAIPLSGKSSLADYMIIASGTSQRHLHTLASHLKKALTGPVSIEGQHSEGWMVVDAGDIIVHLFKPEARRHFNLEKMWGLNLPAAEARA
jgi:ribosome-associated protein